MSARPTLERRIRVVVADDHPAIVILSTHADEHFVKIAKKIGVRVYISKTQVGNSLPKLWKPP
jgi:DNA-binding NarL/FixJ family response regulator